MSFLQVPTRNDVPWYKFTLTLSGQVYTLRFRYNTRMSRWIMDIADSSNNDLLVGIPVLIERDMTGQYVFVTLPSGTFFAMDVTNQGNQPTRYSFGIDAALIYREADT